MTEMNDYLNQSFGTKSEVPIVVNKYEKTRKSKIELAGDHVMKHIIELAQTTDLTYSKITDRINETYNLDLTRSNIVHFFQTNKNLIDELATERKMLNKTRADLYLEHNRNLVNDLKLLEKTIEDVENDDMLDTKDKYKILGDLIDKKGNLLLRHQKLEGNIDTFKTGNVNNMQVNVFQNSETKSEIMDKLRKVKFDDNNTIDVQGEENTDKT